MDFSSALNELKAGKRICRQGWNGKGMWLALVSMHSWYMYDMHPEIGREVKALSPWIGMKTTDNRFVPWLASQTDLLAEDWEVI